MKTLKFLFPAIIALFFLNSCGTIDIPVHGPHGGGGRPPMPILTHDGRFNPNDGYNPSGRPPSQYRDQQGHYQGGQPNYYGGGQPSYGGRPNYGGGNGPNGAGQVRYYGDQAQRVYGNGPQSYVTGLPPSGGYDPNYNYGLGGYSRR